MTMVLDRLARVFGLPLASLAQPILRMSTRRVGLGLLYHRIGDPPGDPARELVPARGTAQFESELRHLNRCYRVVPASRLLEATARRKRGEPFPVSLTFDDDLSSHTEVAMPILERHGLPATFFVCGASLSGPFAFWWELLQAAFDGGKAAAAARLVDESTDAEVPSQSDIHEIARRIARMDSDRRDAVSASLHGLAGQDIRNGLTAQQLRALATKGFEVGFHTRRHDGLPPLEDEQLASAMTDGRDEVAAVTGKELTLIAYPHGRADARVAQAARAAGYRLGFTATPRTTRPTTNPLLIGRLEPTSRSPGRAALQITRRFLASAR